MMIGADYNIHTSANLNRLKIDRAVNKNKPMHSLKNNLKPKHI